MGGCGSAASPGPTPPMLRPPTRRRGASLDDIDPSVLAALSKKQQKKLLKMYTHELKEAAREEAGGADSGGADSGGERKRKREKKEKKGKKEKKEKKKRKKRRRSGSSSGSDESD